MNALTPEQAVLAQTSGEVHALRVCIKALLVSMPQEQRPVFAAKLEQRAEWTIAHILGAAVPEELNQTFAQELQTMREIADQR